MLRRLLKGRPVVRPWRAAELLYLGAQRASSRSLPLIRVRDRMPADNPCLTHGLKAAGQAVSEAGYRLKWAHDPPPGGSGRRVLHVCSGIPQTVRFSANVTYHVVRAHHVSHMHRWAEPVQPRTRQQSSQH